MYYLVFDVLKFIKKDEHIINNLWVYSSAIPYYIVMIHPYHGM